MAGYHCFHLIFEVYLTKLHCNECILFTVGVVFVDRLVCSVNMLIWNYVTLVHWTGRLEHQCM